MDTQPKSTRGNCWGQLSGPYLSVLPPSPTCQHTFFLPLLPPSPPTREPREPQQPPGSSHWPRNRFECSGQVGTLVLTGPMGPNPALLDALMCVIIHGHGIDVDACCFVRSWFFDPSALFICQWSLPIASLLKVCNDCSRCGEGLRSWRDHPKDLGFARRSPPGL